MTYKEFKEYQDSFYHNSPSGKEARLVADNAIEVCKYTESLYQQLTAALGIASARGQDCNDVYEENIKLKEKIKNNTPVAGGYLFGRE